MKNSRFLSGLYIFICIIAISCSNLVQNLRDAVPVSQITYTVTLYAGTRGSFTGETYKTVTVPENTQLDLNLYKPDIPSESQKKWQFNQWLDETGSTIDKPVRITGDCAFLAEYIKLCTVTFKNDNVTVRTIKGIRQNTYIEEPPKLEKDGYEFVGCKVPKMIFALQGRVNQRSQTRRNRVNQSTNSATAFGPTQKQYQANGSYTYGVNNGQGGYAYYAPNPAQQEQTQPATPLVKDLRQQSKRAHGHIWFYHNSPLARKFPPNISVGMVEMNTQVNSTPDLWREIMRNLPYLQTHKDLGAKPTQST